MSSYIAEINISEEDYSKFFAQDVDDLSLVDHHIPNLFRAVFRPEGFAPGVWAGTEGLKIRYKDNDYIIAKVNFQERELRLYKT